jgi:hypothetical protein
VTASTDGSHRTASRSDGGGWKQILWSVAGFILLGGVMVAAAVYTLPDLVSDWQIRHTARPVADARLSDGKCTGKLVFHICNVTVGLQTAKGHFEHRVNYIFTDVHVGDYSISAMADPARPELATTDLGLAQLWNRTVTLAVGAGIIVAIIGAAVSGMLRNRRRAEGTYA